MGNVESTITQLEEHCRNGDSAKFVKVLEPASKETLQKPYRSDKNKDGWPTIGAYVLWFTVLKNEVMWVRIILDYVQVDVKDKHDRTPLHHAVLEDRHHIVSILLEHGAQVNATDNDGQSPIHAAARARNVQILQLLCGATGADCSLQDAAENTPLHCAVDKHRPECVSTLLHHSARIDIHNGDNQTPRELAVEMGSYDIVGLLDKAAATTAIEQASTQPTAATLLPPRLKESAAAGEEVTIPAQGGDFDLHNGTVHLSVPSGAVVVDGVKCTVYMSGSKGEERPFKHSSVYLSQAFMFASDTSLSFHQPVTVTIPNISFSPGGKVLVFSSSSEKGELPDFQDVTEECRPVFANGAVQFTVTHFSEWLFVIAAIAGVSAKEVISLVVPKNVRLDAAAAKDLTSSTDCIPLSLCLAASGSKSPLLSEAGCQLVTSSDICPRMSLAYYQGMDIELDLYRGPQPSKSSASGSGGYWYIPCKFLPVCLKQDTVAKVQLTLLGKHPLVDTPAPGIGWVVAAEGRFKCTIHHYTGGSTEAFVDFLVPATVTAVPERSSRRESRTSSTSSSGATADPGAAASDDAKESMGHKQCEVIRSRGAQLTGSLELDDDIMGKLRAKQVLSFQLYSEIRSKREPLERNQLFLENLPDCGNNAFQVFIDALRESKKPHNQQLARTLESASSSTPGAVAAAPREVPVPVPRLRAKRLSTTSTDAAVPERSSRRESRTSSTSSSCATADTGAAASDDAKESMGRWQCEVIRSHGTQLTGSLELDDVILDTLRTKKVLSPQLYKEIQRKRMPRERNQLLLETLPGCGNNAFQVFIDALRESTKLHNQQLAKTLESTVPSTPVAAARPRKGPVPAPRPRSKRLSTSSTDAGVHGGSWEEVGQQVHARPSAPVSGESDPWESADYRGCYAQLIRTMDPHEVKTLCYTLQLISVNDKQIINSKTTSFEKNEAILDCVARSTSHFGKFREVLHHIDACSDIAKHLDKVGPRRGQDEGCQKARDNLNR